MTVKIECPCGQRFAFDVEPEEGHMPMALACPACGTDLTPVADADIARQLHPGGPAVPAPSPGPVRVALRVAAAEPGAAGPHSAHAAADSVAAPPLSAREQALQRAQIAANATALLTEERATAKDFEGFRRHRLLLRLALVAVAALLGGWIWYTFVGSKPHLAFTFSAPESTRFDQAELVGEDRLVAVTSQKLSVQDWKEDREIWSVTLPKAEAPKFVPKPTIRDEDGERVPVRTPDPDWSGPSRLHLDSGSVWLGRGQSITRYDLATGSKKAEVALAQKADRFADDERSMIAVSTTGPNQELVTRVELGTGKSESLLYTVPSGAKRKAVASDVFYDGADTEARFIPAGAGVAVLATQLLEHRIVTSDGSQPASERKKTPVIDRENLRAADSTEAVSDFLNQNGGAVERDESRFRVTVHRLFATGAEWTGDVVGRPGFFTTPAMDFLVAGTDLTALEKDNRVAWTAKLSYPVGPEYLEGGDRSPVVASGSRLYLFDLGTLTAFDLRSGKAAWRLQTVGATQVLPVGDAVYVATSSAGPEAIKFNQGVHFSDRTFPIILKVEAATGKVLWSLDRMADHVVMAGKFLYVARSAVSLAESLSSSMNQRDADVTFILRRLDPATGKPEWTWMQGGAPNEWSARNNALLVRRRHELKVLKFASW
ncbi:MAG TPA: PQQ-binding-like beta-propeller repeat protein [Candidatus Limnocylindria bacterium]|nr:PQQ-binding-like beta-propeller repeat protein [Candidatus Limnocylindria bacterium]